MSPADPFVGLPAFDLVGCHRGVEGLADDRPCVSGQIQRHLLREVGDTGAGGHRTAAPIGLLVPGEHLQEGGLAAAIAAQQANPLPSLDLPGDAVQERWPAKGDRQVVELNKGHA